MSPYNQGSIRHLFIVAYRPLSTKLIADLLLLFGLCIKETDKLIKISKNVIQLRITLLNYNGYVIVNLFILKFYFLLVAKISFYFESAKKTGEKFREKLGFQNHCPHPYHPPNRYQDTMKGLYAHLSSWHIDPCRFP